MKNIKILITSAGASSAVDVIKALKEIKKYKIKIMAIDKDINASGLYLGDDYNLVKKVSNLTYIKKILSLCKKNKINFIFPIHSKEIELFSKYRNIFLNKKIGILIDKLSNIKLLNNKIKFYEFLKQANFDFPKYSSSVKAST